MQYIVKEIANEMMLADSEGIVLFDTVESAKDGGIGAGVSFMVVEEAYPFETMTMGINTGMGFFFLGGEKRRRKTLRKSRVSNMVADKSSLKHFRPLV